MTDTRPRSERHSRPRTTSPPTLGLRRFWRIPVAVVLGAVLGFGTSFLFGVAYAASTRVLIRVNNQTFLKSDGSTLSSQNAQVEQSGVSRIVSETQSALLGNQVIATKIVEQLNLDKKEDEKGWFNAVKRGLATVVKYTYSYLIHGEYKKLPRFEQAVRDTQKGLSAKAVGFSDMLAVTGKWKTPERATEIANAAADYLIETSEQRFQSDVTENTRQLGVQVGLAGERSKKAAADLATFALANALDTTKLGVALTPELALKLPPDLQTQYQALQAEYNTSLATFGQMQVQYQQAQFNAGVKPVELTRIDSAVPTVYPVAPKRWLYMAIGIVLGSLIGLLLTARAFWRRGETLFPRDDDFDPRGDDDAPHDDAGGRAEPPAEPRGAPRETPRRDPAPRELDEEPAPLDRAPLPERAVPEELVLPEERDGLPELHLSRAHSRDLLPRGGGQR